MEYRQLGKSDIEVSTVSLGCWTMGGPNWNNGNPIGWADVDEDEVTQAVKYAIDHGVNHFDNADIYGNGQAERMLASVLNRLGVNSNDFIIATKVGHFKGTAEHAYDPIHIRHQCEQSLKNLQRDFIDIYYFHHGDFGEDDVYLHGAVEVINALVQEGKIRIKGQSAYSEAHFEKLVPVVQPTVLQSWANMERPHFIYPGSIVSELMKKNELSFVAFSPLAQGRLLDKFDPDNPPAFQEGDNRANNPAFHAEALTELKPKLEQIKSRFGHETSDLATTCVNYILNQPYVACAIPGFRNLNQVKCNLAAIEQSLTSDDVNYINRTFGHHTL